MHVLLFTLGLCSEIYEDNICHEKDKAMWYDSNKLDHFQIKEKQSIKPWILHQTHLVRWNEKTASFLYYTYSVSHSKEGSF